MTDPVFVIAEAGVNHNGSLDLALDLVDAAAAAGADAVKFQTFTAEALATRAAPKAAYQERAAVAEADQFSMLKKLELDEAAHRTLFRRCEARGIEFMSTPFDEGSVRMLDALGVRRFKIASGELNNPLLLRAVAAANKPILVSSGMATLSDLEFALRIIAGGEEAYWSEEGQTTLLRRVTLLHCTTEYPAPPEAVNLRAMATIAAAFGLPVGYSDHTEGTAVSIAAVALGARAIEKHFTLDRSLPGPDHAASLPAAELPEFVKALRVVGAALGSPRKVPNTVEIPNRAIARRSVVAKTFIKRGEPFSIDNLALKRPGTGIAASRFDDLLRRAADRDYLPDDLIEG